MEVCPQPRRMYIFTSDTRFLHSQPHPFPLRWLVVCWNKKSFFLLEFHTGDDALGLLVRVLPGTVLRLFDSVEGRRPQILWRRITVLPNDDPLPCEHSPRRRPLGRS